MTKIDMAYLSKWIGKTQEKTDVITPRLVSQFGATFGEYIGALESNEVPAAFHWILSPDADLTPDLGVDGYSAPGAFLPPVPLPGRMWAGGQVDTLLPLQLGDEVVRKATISDIVHKQGRTGNLVFVTVDFEFITGRGVAIRESQNIVYREVVRAEAGNKSVAETDVQDHDIEWRVSGSPVLLFRYSALTFNAHRIHYDEPYATSEENYPGLIVHGPLQASLLMNLVAKSAGKIPEVFTHRGLSPVYAGSDFSVRMSKIVDGKATCWICDENGQTTMAAKVSWAE